VRFKYVIVKDGRSTLHIGKQVEAKRRMDNEE
jgi:hypothetical protein